jgi:hypothetical protein
LYQKKVFQPKTGFLSLYYCMYYHIKLSKCRTAVRNILPTYMLSKTDQGLRTKRKFGRRQIASLLGLFTDGDRMFLSKSSEFLHKRSSKRIVMERALNPSPRDPKSNGDSRGKRRSGRVSMIDPPTTNSVKGELQNIESPGYWIIC